jgi:hypothetical protein
MSKQITLKVEGWHKLNSPQSHTQPITAHNHIPNEPTITEDNYPLDLETGEEEYSRINVCKQIKRIINVDLHGIFSLLRDLLFYTIIPEPLYGICTSHLHDITSFITTSRLVKPPVGRSPYRLVPKKGERRRRLKAHQEDRAEATARPFFESEVKRIFAKGGTKKSFKEKSGNFFMLWGRKKEGKGGRKGGKRKRKKGKGGRKRGKEKKAEERRRE